MKKILRYISGKTLTAVAAISIAASALTADALAQAAKNLPAKAKRYSFIVHQTMAHETTSYTQGLEIERGVMYEATGLYGQSRLLKHNMRSGETTVMATLPKNQFGEGITIIGDSIYMLTWREGQAHIFNKRTGERIDTKRYAGEGWGLTSNDGRLYMSDGSCTITTRDPKTFQKLESHIVTLDGRPIEMINELEWIGGKIWANIYQTDSIVIIDPEKWVVEGVIDLTGLLPQSERTPKTDVLNGIAYDRETKKIYVTGKNWSKIFQIEIVER